MLRCHLILCRPAPFMASSCSPCEVEGPASLVSLSAKGLMVLGCSQEQDTLLLAAVCPQGIPPAAGVTVLVISGVMKEISNSVCMRVLEYVCVYECLCG